MRLCGLLLLYSLIFGAFDFRKAWLGVEVQVDPVPPPRLISCWIWRPSVFVFPGAPFGRRVSCEAFASSKVDRMLELLGRPSESL